MNYVFDKIKLLKRVSQIFDDNDYVNLGIGIPSLVANYIPKDKQIILQSENGMLGMGGEPKNADKDLQTAGGTPSSILEGGCFFDSATSFAMIRGGHLDYTVLGYLEVDQHANIANYMIPGKMVPGMGGAMDLVVGVKNVIVIGTHLDKKGRPKLLKSCSLPLTGRGVVSMVVTDAALFGFENDKFLLREIFAPYTLEWVLANTAGDVVVARDMKVVEIV